MQFQADILDRPVVRPAVGEITAVGAGYAAGLTVGLYKEFDDFRAQWSSTTRGNRIWKSNSTKGCTVPGRSGTENVLEPTCRAVSLHRDISQVAIALMPPGAPLFCIPLSACVHCLRVLYGRLTARVGTGIRSVN